MAYEILEDFVVKFEPRGAMADLNYTFAIAKLNKTESAEEINWIKAGNIEGQDIESEMGSTAGGSEEIDLVLGTNSFGEQNIMDNASFLAKHLDPETFDLKIQVIANTAGRQLYAALKMNTPIRFTADLEMDPDMIPVSFNRFYIVTE